MTHKARVLVGVVTAAILLTLAAVMWGDGRVVLGALLAAAGLFRLVVLVRQLAALWATDD